jgi:hypothetical protein
MKLELTNDLVSQMSLSKVPAPGLPYAGCRLGKDR